MYFNRIDVCEAYYMFACLYHAGMGSEEYYIFTRLHRCGFKPHTNLSVETLSENGRAIFDDLVKRRHLTPYESPLDWLSPWTRHT